MMRTFSQVCLSLIFGFTLAGAARAQNVLDDINATPASGTDGQAPELANEKVVRISASRRIFILTNDNASYDKGDFVSLLTGQQLVTRALVAKVHEKQSGIKILKIYNVDLWNKLRSGQDVQVLRGDDSYYKLADKKAGAPKEAETKIESEDDLFNQTTMNDDDLSLDENNNRHIKTDNLITLTYGMIQSLDSDGGEDRYGHPAFQWGYQFADNIWGEVGLGQTLVKEVPDPEIDTKLTAISFKLKYAISAPFNSYVMPYVGYQVVKADSPGAGEKGTEAKRKAELQLVEDMNKSSVIFGATLLKRLVPGWFARLDVGTDIYGLGFGLEF